MSKNKKKIKNFFFFDDSIERVFNFIKDFKKTDSIFEDIRSSTKITRGINTFEPGNMFHYNVNSKKVEFQVLSYEDEEKLKSVKWFVKAESLEYEYEYILHKCTVGGEVILEWNLDFSENTPIDKDMALKDLSECMLRVQAKLSSDLTDYYVSEAIIIKSDRNSVLKLILSLDSLKVNRIFGKVKYSDDPKKFGSKIYMIYPMIGLELKFIVDKADFNDQSYEWSYVLKLKSNSLNISPVKEIIFSVIKVHSKKTFVEIKHTFTKIVSKELLASIKGEQANFLKDLKSLLVAEEKDIIKDEDKETKEIVISSSKDSNQDISKIDL